MTVATLAAGGATVASRKATVDADIAARATEPIRALLVNLGVNDISGGLPSQAQWEADLGYILDAFHTQYPPIQVYVMRPWMGYCITNPDCDTVATWIGNVVTARAGWANLGPDERVWLENGDGGVTMTTDLIHYSAAGNAECAAQWKTVLGY